MSAHLAELPSELYSCILDFAPDQQTVLAVTRALPFAPIPVHYLFRSVCIRHPDTAPRLYRRIRAGLNQNGDLGSPGDTFDASTLVHHMSVETWNIDADVLINLLRLLPNLRTLTLWIGPSNFSPEHLEEMFKPPMSNLVYLSLRFRPYVKKATYYQFLKGSYFDSTLLALSAWPPSRKGLPTLSIVQDSFTPDHDDPVPRFAQPIVFFRLDLYLSLLVHSNASHTSLTSLRVRIPARPIIQPLTVAYLNPNIQNNPEFIPPPPYLEFLDIATCNVSETDIEKLLIRFTRLKHLVLDGCSPLLRSGSPQATGSELDWWSALGRRLALAGVKRAKDREKELKEWYEAQHRERPRELRGGEEEIIDEPRRPRRGRRGLATATITLRGVTNSPPRAGPSSSSKHIAPLTPTQNLDLGSTGRAQKPVPPPKVHIIPPLPVLSTISLFPAATPNTPAAISPHARALIHTEFEKGWNDGIRVIWEMRARMGATYLREPSVKTPRPKFFVFKEKGDGGDGDSDDENVGREGHKGLEDVLYPGEENIFFRSENPLFSNGDPPILCLAGSDITSEGHAIRCVHHVGRELGLESL